MLALLCPCLRGRQPERVPGDSNAQTAPNVVQPVPNRVASRPRRLGQSGMCPFRRVAPKTAAHATSRRVTSRSRFSTPRCNGHFSHEGPPGVKCTCRRPPPALRSIAPTCLVRVATARSRLVRSCASSDPTKIAHASVWTKMPQANAPKNDGVRGCTIEDGALTKAAEIIA